MKNCSLNNNEGARFPRQGGIGSVVCSEKASGNFCQFSSYKDYNLNQ